MYKIIKGKSFKQLEPVIKRLKITEHQKEND